MPDLDKIISLIEKLLVYNASNSTTAEFEAAQRKLQQLITKYQIDMSQLHGTDGDDITCEYVSMPKNASMYSVLLNTVAKHNFCKVLRYDDSCLIYGYHDDIKICISVYSLLALDMQLSHDRGKNKASGRGWSKSFYIGYCIGVGERLLESKQATINTMQSTDTSVVLAIKDKQHAIEEFYQNLDASPSNSYRASSTDTGYIAGHASGRNADIGQTKVEE